MKKQTIIEEIDSLTREQYSLPPHNDTKAEQYPMMCTHTKLHRDCLVCFENWKRDQPDNPNKRAWTEKELRQHLLDYCLKYPASPRSSIANFISNLSSTPESTKAISDWEIENMKHAPGKLAPSSSTEVPEGGTLTIDDMKDAYAAAVQSEKECKHDGTRTIDIDGSTTCFACGEYTAPKTQPLPEIEELDFTKDYSGHWHLKRTEEKVNELVRIVNKLSQREQEQS